MKKELREQQEQVRVLRKKWSAHPALNNVGEGSLSPKADASNVAKMIRLEE